jgi:DNA helicase HerA-like ATPase
VQVPEKIFVGMAEEPVYLLPQFGNRHGLVTGATGTGKTVTLQVLAEGFSARGVPVFLADVKGDLSGICQEGGGKAKLEERAKQIGLEPYEYLAFPVVYWDLFGQQGHPIRTTVSEMGPMLLSRLMNLNDVQEGVLNLAFKLADDHGLLLLDMKDLRAMLAYVAEHASELTREYGNVSQATVGTIQRSLLTIEQDGADAFFGEPALQLEDIMRVAPDGRGYINILAADGLMQRPKVYATFLLWLLSELFEELPEVGDVDKPKLVFFFDEAHLLFDEAPPALVDKVEQVVRLIRSKGVGIYFVTQNPIDVPDQVLGQLGNKVQHALRAFTPREQRAVRAAAETFRQNPGFDTEEVITQLGVGEALVSCLEDKGVPMVVQRTLIRPPASRLGPADADRLATARTASPIRGKYDKVVDRESAFEILRKKAGMAADAPASGDEMEVSIPTIPFPSRDQAPPRRERPPARRSDSLVESLAKSVLRGAGSQIGRQIVRGILGGLTGRR